jgi:hypothetical protein
MTIIFHHLVGFFFLRRSFFNKKNVNKQYKVSSSILIKANDDPLSDWFQSIIFFKNLKLLKFHYVTMLRFILQINQK